MPIRTFLPEPDPSGEMLWAEGYYDSMYGRIFSRWEIVGDQLIYEAIVPANTTATLYLPAASDKDVLENGQAVTDARGIEFVNFENGKAFYQLQSGKYIFETSN